MARRVVLELIIILCGKIIHEQLQSFAFMILLTQMLMLATIHLLSVMSPGPDFTLVTRLALTESRNHALGAAFGIILGVAFHLSWVFFGLAQLGNHAPLFLRIITILGSMYLFYMGIKLIYSSWNMVFKKAAIKFATDSNTPQSNSHLSILQNMGHGFVTNLLNPKAIMYFMSVGSQFIKPEMTSATRLIFAIEIVVITFAWFATLSFLAAHPIVKFRMLEWSPKINLVTGFIFIFFAVNLILLK